jgi:hypothetical protein
MSVEDLAKKLIKNLCGSWGQLIIIIVESAVSAFYNPENMCKAKPRFHLMM